MTNEEAIQYIIRHCNPDYPKGKTEWETAINMAINALKAQLSSCSEIPNSSDDLISRQAAIDAKQEFRNPNVVRNTEARTAYDRTYANGWNDCNSALINAIKALPSVHSKQLQVLADVLDGCPLTQPCDKMWRGGWCEEHCKNNKLQEPNAECWLKYAEVMAADDT